MNLLRERCLLWALMEHSHMIPRVFGQLSALDPVTLMFSDPVHREIFKAMAHCPGDSWYEVSKAVPAEMRNAVNGFVSSPLQIGALPPVDIMVMDIHDEAEKERSAYHAGILADKLKAGHDPGFAIEEYQKEAKARPFDLEMPPDLNDPFTTANLIDDVEAVPTGLKELDERMGGGLEVGDVFISGGLSSVGKSTLALNIAGNIVKSGAVLFYSLEDGLIRCQRRRILMHYKGAKSMGTVRAEMEKPREQRFKDWDMDLPRGFFARCGIRSADAIIADIRRLAPALNPRLVVIDYIQQVTFTSDRAPHENIDRFLADIKDAGEQYRFAGLVVSQVTQEATRNKKAGGGDFKGSSGIFQMAGAAVVITQKEAADNPNHARILKNHLGSCELVVEFEKLKDGERKPLRFYYDRPHYYIASYDDMI